MKKLTIVIALLIVLTVLVSVAQLQALRHADLSISGKIIVLILFNLNIIALLTLMFFVAKALVKLYLERKRGVLGSRFKIKIAVIFVVLTSIPSVLMFVAASGLLSNYIDRWFTPQFREPIDSTLRIAAALYDIERKKTLEAAQALVAEGSLPSGYTILRLSELPPDASDVVKDAFMGEEGTEVISGKEGDVVRAVVPSFQGGSLTGVVIIESRIPREITRNVESIKSAYDDFIKLEEWKQPLKLNYLFFLGFFTLIVIFAALWVSLRIARGISEPIQKLAQATEEVASGDLDVRIADQRDDEIGVLITSFNHMVKELKDGKESLQTAYTESTRRRVCMESIVENIQSGVISLDADGNVLTLNSAACSILDMNPEAVVGRNYRQILSAIHSDSLEEMIKGIRLKTLQREERNVWATIKGRRAMLRISIMGLRDEGAHYIGLLVVFEDLTDVIKAQKALAWQEVARRIAHEVKNPLTPIKLSTERMLKKWEHHDHDFGEVFERSTKAIIKQVDGLRNLVDEFSRFGKMPAIHKTPTALAAVIGEVADLYREYRALSIAVELPGDMPLVDLDRDQFKRVLVNLVENAIQAMEGKGAITIKGDFMTAVNRVRIEVADDGPGIKDEDKDKLFLPYFSTKRGGTGLGLAIAGKIITEHMGYIRVRDNHPRGSVFTIEMPIKEG